MLVLVSYKEVMCLDIQGEHKVFPRLQTLITRKILYVEYKHISPLPKM